MSLGPMLPMYEMPCPCGMVWYTTRAVVWTDDYCEERDRGGRRLRGCGARLPEPRPEVRS